MRGAYCHDREAYSGAGAEAPRGFGMLDRDVRLARPEPQVAADMPARAKFGLGTCLGIYSYSVNAGCPLEETLVDSFPWCDEWEAELKRLFAAYVAAKQRDNVLDYDDLLLYWHEAVQMPGIAAQMRADFDHILVDEYQDTNRLQAAILLALAPDGAGLTVVGDEAQSIYAFRAPRNAPKPLARRLSPDPALTPSASGTGYASTFARAGFNTV